MPTAYGLGTSKKKKKPYADYEPCPRPMAWARVISTYCTCLQWSVNLNFAEIVTSFQRSSTSNKYKSSHKLSTCCQVQLSSYRVYQHLMILGHSSGFRQRVFAVSLIQLASYSLMIQGPRSFAQHQDKVAVCKWRYKHSLTSLECYNMYQRLNSYKTPL